MRKNWILYIFLFLLLVAMLHESFWTEMFSVVKFLLILLAIFLIPIIVRFLIFMFILIKNFRAIRNSSQNPFTFYSRTYGSNTNSTNNYGYSYKFNPFFRRNRKNNMNGSESQANTQRSKVIEICPICGYEKGENHICPNTRT